jgi:F0F1-type ATP synthase assembly protein I
MRIITFGKINKKFLIPIIGGILSLIYRFIANCNPKYNTAATNPFIMSIYTALGMILSFIPYLIVKYRSKKRNLNIIENKTKLNKVFTHHYIFNNKSLVAKYKLIILSAVFDFIETSLVLVFCTKCIYNLWIFDILFISLFSYWLLKAKLYKHQYLSMIIIIILGLILNIIEYYKSDKKNKFDALEIFLKFLVEIFMSLCIVIAKYNMEKNYCSPYEICIWEGLIELILYIIFLLIINKLELTIADVKYPDNFWELINNYDINDFWLCLLIVFVNAIYNLFIFLTCNYFTPCHVT